MKQNEETRCRRIACGELITPQGEHLTRYVVELSDGKVATYYPLKSEQPRTEWWSGTISLRDEGGNIRAYYKGETNHLK